MKYTFFAKECQELPIESSEGEPQRRSECEKRREKKQEKKEQKGVFVPLMAGYIDSKNGEWQNDKKGQMYLLNAWLF